MSGLRETLKASLTDAMKAGDTQRVATLRLIAAALKDRDIAARSSGNEEGINEAEMLSMLQTMIKQRQESAKMYREGGRDELAAAEEAEIETIRQFLPAQMDEGEIRAAAAAAIEETGAATLKDMGRVMGALKAEHAGKMDFAAAGAMVKDMLLGKAD